MQVLKRFVGGVGVALVLTGCAAQLVSSNPRSVLVRAGTAMMGSAQALADAECKKEGRYARLSSKPSPTEYAFDCVT